MRKNTHHLLFLSTLNFTSNPRLYKEVQLALQHNFQVTVLLFKLGNWSDEMEESKLLLLKGATIQYIPAFRKPFLPWLLSTGLEQLFSRLPIFNNLFIQALAHSKRTILLLEKLKEIDCKTVSLIVAHNLGALYPAYAKSKNLKVPFGFDVEDYHPGELIKKANPSAEKSRRELLMKKLLPHASYVSYASQLINEATEKLYPIEHKPAVTLTVLNSFSQREFSTPAKELKGPVSFVWFSQNISEGRGLEVILPAMETVKEKVRLTLIGHLKESFSAFIQKYSFVEIEHAMPQTLLHQRIQEFDVGIASDMSSADENRKMALTNKMLAYKQAGLFIMATDTPAQVQFLESFPKEGVCTAQNKEAASATIAYIAENIQQIRLERIKRFQTGLDVSWESESKKVIKCWNHLLMQ